MQLLGPFIKFSYDDDGGKIYLEIAVGISHPVQLGFGIHVGLQQKCKVFAEYDVDTRAVTYCRNNSFCVRLL